MAEIKAARADSQPIRTRTGGSTFKNPPGEKAWQLIEQADAAASRAAVPWSPSSHCNFPDETGTATAADLEDLGEDVRARVRETSGVEAGVGNPPHRRTGGPEQRGRCVMSRRVAVLMGGISAEREVSLVSGRALLQGAGEAGYDAFEIDVTHDVAALVAALTPVPDVVFNALHGRWGEDGCVQGLLELLHIPYTHSGVMASALAMDKPIAKSIVAAAGIVSPKGIVVRREVFASGDVLERPYVIKPLNEDRAFGVRIVLEGDNKPPIDDANWAFRQGSARRGVHPGARTHRLGHGRSGTGGHRDSAQKGFLRLYGQVHRRAGRSLGPRPAGAGRDRGGARRRARRASSARLPWGLALRLPLRRHNGAKGRLYWLEINTQPGMTPLSLVPEQAAHLGISFPDLCAWMVENASCDS